ncbi:MAG: hypothetical protein KC535_03450 [Nanoarchaeota archaeon]|nr:hypothetical protein [Nanoarchaeota archaeon]
MKGRVVLLGIVFLIALASFSLAASLSGEGFYTSSGELIDKIGPAGGSIVLIGDLEFSISTTVPLDAITADLSQVSANQGDILRNEPRAGFKEGGLYGTAVDIKEYCQENLDEQGNLAGYSCSVPNLRLQPASSQVKITFTLRLRDTTIYTESIEKIITFTQDTTKPVATDLLTEFCDATTCYISPDLPTTIEVKLQDDNPFSAYQVYFRVGSSSVQPFTFCEEGSCRSSYVYTGDCESGQEISLRLDARSKDAVGNSFESNIERTIICDTQGPVLEEITYEEPPSPFPDFKTGDNIVIHALVSEDASGVTAAANFSSLTGSNASVPGDCEKESEGRYDCTWTAQQVKTGTHEIYFTFADGAGKTYESDPEVVTVLYYDTQTATSDLDFFDDVRAEPNSPYGYSRLAIDIAEDNGMEYPIFATFKLKPTEPNLQYIKTNIRRCVYSNGTDEIPASNIAAITVPVPTYDYADNVGQNRVDINFIRSTNAISNNILFICEMEMIVKKENTIYNQPATFNMTIQVILKDSQLGSIGEVYAEKIKKKEDLVSGTFYNVIEKTGDVLSTIGKVCSGVTKASSVYAGLTASDSVLSGCAASQTPASGPCEAGSKVLGKLGDAISGIPDAVLGEDGIINMGSGLNTGSGFGDNFDGNGFTDNWLKINKEDSLLDVACKLATCSAEGREEEAGLFGGDFFSSNGESGWGGYLGRVGDEVDSDLFTGVGVPDPKESIVSAVQSQCAPALVYHIEKLREMECSQLACYKWAAQMGLDISTCDKEKSQLMCQEIVSETFSILPTKAIEDFADNANGIIQNSLPAALKFFLGNPLCPSNFETKDSHPVLKFAWIVGCQLPKSIGQVSYQLTDTAQNNGAFVYPDLQGCDFALCNGENIQDCANAGPIPAYLQQYNDFAVPPQNVPQTTDLSPEAVITSMNRFDYEKNIQPTPEDIRILKLYTRFDYDSDENKNKDIRVVQEDAWNYAQSAASIAVYARDNGATLYINPDTNRLSVDWASQKITVPQVGTTTFNDITSQAGEALRDLEDSKELFDTNNQNIIISNVILSGQEGVDYRYDQQTGSFQTGYTQAYTDEELLSFWKNVEAQYAAQGKDFEDFKAETPDKFVPDGNIDATLSELDQNRLEKLQESQDEYDKINDDYETVKNAYLTKLEDQIKDLDEKIEKASGKEKELLIEQRNDLSAEMKEKASETENQKKERQEKELIARVRQKDLQVQAAVGIVTDAIVQNLLQNGHLKFLQWEDQLGIGAFDSIDNLLNSEKRKQLICNELITINNDNGFDSIASQCSSDGFCNPVLSFAAEKIKRYEDTTNNEYIYTATWFVGNVNNEKPYLKDEDQYFKYKVLLRGGNNPQLKLNKGEWAELKFGYGSDENQDSVQISFNVTGNYEQICFDFAEKFPPSSPGSKTEYCRTIQDTTAGVSFDTGNPIPDDYFSDPENNGNNNGNDWFANFCSNGGFLCGSSSAENKPYVPNPFELEVGQ